MRGRLRIVGIGPGDPSVRTFRAVEAIKESEVVVGYETYIGLIKDLLEGKEVIPAKMRQEIFRAEISISKALEGRKVALVSDGDPNVYGMAPLVFELMAKRGVEVDVEVIPGVTAALAAAAKLGAPLGSDFAVINLSDLLTPREAILRRVKAAAEADFVLVFYNPIDSGLTKAALEVVRSVRGDSTPVGLVKNAYRQGEEVRITALGEVDMDWIDMRTTIIVGNSETFTWRGYLITPRGYSNKYRL
ncbi:cobalamin biosynthesis precorrin-3 methylase (cbiF) [Pyrobaculum aerophilum str. IM2]|uniref:Cobalamin biosynthesis precorrin-3 methylase (CbiF) n=2 Tax=Pyrobaculum aerophilum TaxID=13773 RepID=Q8ZZB1_PYRAE|nr:precorrin-3B C(17)-methyltransferase [Pyrobaculum aerophilum]AAL62730.1 cobalamin biosynthesis precorrin-3 methylase (cbiF) [Pyrobaculum aerophilum str. IM2]HII46915.1 precorrin-3B C(17)-methyltransferase [Pyrobaculum aerophilum]